MIPRIKKLKIQDNYQLLVTFDNDRVVEYDVKEDIETISVFKDLMVIKGLFEQVQLDESRTCVFWNEQIDLASDTIYEYGKELPSGNY